MPVVHEINNQQYIRMNEIKLYVFITGCCSDFKQLSIKGDSTDNVKVEIKVKDDGNGIPQKVVEKYSSLSLLPCLLAREWD
jgi:nitrogen-specific signal transduction histidine kinase